MTTKAVLNCLLSLCLTGTGGLEVMREGGAEFLLVASSLYEQGLDMSKYSEQEVLF